MREGYILKRSRRSEKKRVMRCISLFTVVLFFMTTSGLEVLGERSWAQQAYTNIEFTDIVSDIVPGSVPSWKFAGKDLVIPPGMAEVADSYSSSYSNTKVIHIQDAHCEYYCQKKITDIIGYLHEKYGIKKINLEGGEGEYDISPFLNIEDPSLRKRVADHFLAEGMLNGAEYFAINNPDNVRLWGVEDTGLYIDNLNAYRGSLEKRLPAHNAVASIKRELSLLINRAYSAELLEMHEMFEKYKDGKSELREYLSFLFDRAARNMANVKDLPNVYLLNFAVHEEENIDFSRANIERNRLVHMLRSRLSPYAIEKLYARIIAYSSADISSGEFYSFLFRNARMASIDLDELPELRKYGAYVAVYEAIDRSLVMEEIDLLWFRIMDDLYQNDMQKEINSIGLDMRLLSDMLSLKITRKQYDHYDSNRERFCAERILRSIRQKNLRLGEKSQEDIDAAVVNDYREDISEFYELAFKRDEIFLRNIKMSPLKDKDGFEAVILITGGFHSENLFELFRRNNIPYLSIIPEFSIGDRSNPYFRLLAGRKPPLAEYMSARISNLALYSYLCGEATRRVHGLGREDVENMVLAAASALGGVAQYSPSGQGVTFIASEHSPENMDGDIELIPGVLTDGRSLWAVWHREKLVSPSKRAVEQRNFPGRMRHFLGELFKKVSILPAVLVMIAFPLVNSHSAVSAESVHEPHRGIPAVQMSGYPMTAYDLLPGRRDLAEKAIERLELLTEWRNTIPGIEYEHPGIEAERRFFQIIYGIKEIDPSALEIYRKADETVRKLAERDIHLGVGISDYMTLSLVESDMAHIMGGVEMLLGSGAVHSFRELTVSSAGAVSHMQIMEHMVDSINKIIAQADNSGIEYSELDPFNARPFDGDTLAATRYFILRQLDLAETVDVNRIKNDAEYAERVGIALYLITAFEINRWRVVSADGRYQIFTNGMLAARGQDPGQFPTLGEYLSEVTQVGVGDFVLAAYNVGSGEVIKALLRSLRERKPLIGSGNLLDETERQLVMAYFFRTAIEMLVDLDVLHLRLGPDHYDVFVSAGKTFLIDADDEESDIEGYVIADEDIERARSLSMFIRNLWGAFSAGSIIASLMIVASLAASLRLLRRSKDKRGFSDISGEDLSHSVPEKFAGIFYDRLLSYEDGAILLKIESEGKDIPYESAYSAAESFISSGRRDVLISLAEEDPGLVGIAISSYQQYLNEEQDRKLTESGAIAKGFDHEELVQIISARSYGGKEGFVAGAAKDLRNALPDPRQVDPIDTALKINQQELEILRDLLSSPFGDGGFSLFESLVKDTEKYVLGTERSLAVDIIVFVAAKQGKDGLPDDLLEEYILHEAMERLTITDENGNILTGDAKHHEIIKRTTEFFGRGKYETPGQTPLGKVLREFIDNKAELSYELRQLNDRVERLSGIKGTDVFDLSVSGTQRLISILRGEMSQIKTEYADILGFSGEVFLTEVERLLTEAEGLLMAKASEKLGKIEKEVSSIKKERMPIIAAPGIKIPLHERFERTSSAIDDMERALENVDLFGKTSRVGSTIAEYKEKLKDLQIDLAIFALKNGEVEFVSKYDRLYRFFEDNFPDTYYFNTIDGSVIYREDIILALLESEGWEDRDDKINGILIDIRPSSGKPLSPDAREKIREILATENLPETAHHNILLRSLERVGITGRGHQLEMLEMVSDVSRKLAVMHTRERGLLKARSMSGLDISDLGATMSVYETSDQKIIVKTPKPSRERASGRSFDENTEKSVKNKYRIARNKLGRAFVAQIIDDIDHIIVESTDSEGNQILERIGLPSGYVIVQNKVETLEEKLSGIENRLSLLKKSYGVYPDNVQSEIDRLSEEKRRILRTFGDPGDTGPEPKWSGGLSLVDVMKSRGIYDSDHSMRMWNYGMDVYGNIVSFDADNFVVDSKKKPNIWSLPPFIDPGKTDEALGLIIREYSGVLSGDIEFEKEDLIESIIRSLGHDESQIGQTEESAITERGPPLTFESGKEDEAGTVICSAGEKVKESEIGGKFMREKITDNIRASEDGFFRQLFNGEKLYSFVVSDDPRDERGNLIEIATLGPARTGISAAVRRWAEIKKFGNITLGDYMGEKNVPEAIAAIEKAVKEIGDISDPHHRIKCSISARVWDRLNEDVRELLREKTMLSIIEDRHGEAVYPLPSGRLHNKAISRFNIVNYIRQLDKSRIADLKNDDYFNRVLLSYAYSMGLVSGREDVLRIRDDLLSKMTADPMDFFARSVFKINLPPIEKFDMGKILELFQAEAEVFRSL